MDLYILFKTLHVLSAVVWVGGASLGVALGLRAARSADDDLLRVMNQLKWCADRVFVPASMATLISGLIMTWLGGLWLETWVLIALAGIASTMAIGIGVLGPRIERALKLQADGESGVATEVARRALWAGSFDLSLLLIVVVDMVVKPSSQDLPVLTIFAALVVVSAAILLPRALAHAPTYKPNEV
jgi:uncharacterized membrane protein